MLNKVLERAFQKIFLLFNDKPYIGEELLGIEELRDTIDKLSMKSTYTNQNNEIKWSDNIERLSTLIKLEDPNSFLRWDIILETMFIDCVPYLNKELRYIKQLGNWHKRWKSAIIESPVGSPIHYWRYPASSGNLIHHAYHLSRFEEETHSKVSDFNFIVEFGGGYGSLCRLAHNLGFKGKYIIFDLPHFSALQKCYLKSLGLKIQSKEMLSDSDPGIICISDIEDLEKLKSYHFHCTNSLFIATWSLSETPLAFRNSVLDYVGIDSSILIAYQDYFEGNENHRFFSEWKLTQPHLQWYHQEIPHLKSNRYLFGTKPHKYDS